ncbi:glycosyltransferase family 4 protein [Sulfitobacter sp. 1A13191]|uniref:glycosyltransferase family 4 protein n=1 Tax=Sulfitobacter sp. 1A13191 TaxID=3368589 RepID=UPI0037455DED
MKLTILSRYTRLGASSRLRTMQYLPALRKAGFEVEVASFFDEAYLESLYDGLRDKRRLPHFTVNRLAQCRRARRSDVIWVEKEALPWFPWVLERFAIPRGVPMVSDYDDAVFHRYDQHRKACVRSLLGRKIDQVMAHSSLVTAGNMYLADRARLAGAPKIEIVPTVVDAEAYQPRSICHTDGKLRIGWIGTPQTWQKYGQPRMAFFEELANKHNIRFHLVGARLAAASERPFDYIPWSEESEIEAIQGMDIGIMPLMDSPWERGKNGYKLVQYMACGLPVVASPVGVNTEIVQAGINGFLASSETEWSEALETLITNAKLRRTMGRAGRKRIIETYSIQVQGPRVAKMLADVAKQGMS